MPATPGLGMLGRKVRGRCPNSDEVRRICGDTPESRSAKAAVRHEPASLTPSPLSGNRKERHSPLRNAFIFRPLETLEVPGVGTGQLYEMTGSTQNLKGEPMLDKMAARCT